MLADLGLTVSDVVRITLTRVAKDGALPFELTPNKQTAETLAKSDRGDALHAAADSDELFAQLGI